MVGTIKRGIANNIFSEKKLWPSKIEDVLFGYLRRRMGPHLLPFHLLYGVPPRMTPFDSPAMSDDPQNPEEREIETLAIQSARARRDQVARSDGPPIETFKDGDLVLVARAKALGALKMPPFESKWFGPCKVMRASHPLYDLRLANGKKTRKPIHSRRLKKWVPRDIVATVYQPPDYACNDTSDEVFEWDN